MALSHCQLCSGAHSVGIIHPAIAGSVYQCIKCLSSKVMPFHSWHMLLCCAPDPLVWFGMQIHRTFAVCNRGIVVCATNSLVSWRRA